MRKKKDQGQDPPFTAREVDMLLPIVMEIDEAYVALKKASLDFHWELGGIVQRVLAAMPTARTQAFIEKVGVHVSAEGVGLLTGAMRTGLNMRRRLPHEQLAQAKEAGLDATEVGAIATDAFDGGLRANYIRDARQQRIVRLSVWWARVREQPVGEVADDDGSGTESGHIKGSGRRPQTDNGEQNDAKNA